MKLSLIITALLLSSLTFAANQNASVTKKSKDKTSNEELRLALLNLNSNIEALSNLGENKNNDLIDELSNNEVNNGLNNLKNTNQ